MKTLVRFRLSLNPQGLPATPSLGGALVIAADFQGGNHDRQRHAGRVPARNFRRRTGRQAAEPDLPGDDRRVKERQDGV